TGVDEGDLPVLDVAGEKIHSLPTTAHHEVVGDRLLVLEEIALDHVGPVAEAEDELVVPVMGVVPHHVPEDGPVSQWDHRLGDRLRVVPEPHSQAATEEYDLHDLSFPTGSRAASSDGRPPGSSGASSPAASSASAARRTSPKGSAERSVTSRSVCSPS